MRNLQSIMNYGNSRIKSYADYSKKAPCEEDKLCKLLHEVDCHKENVVQLHKTMSSYSFFTESITLVRKVDACCALTTEITWIVNERICKIEAYNPEKELDLLRQLKQSQYAQSLFNSPSSAGPSIKNKELADTIADIAGKEKEIDFSQLEYEHKLKLSDIEKRYRENIQAHQEELINIEVKKKMEVQRARIEAYQEVLHSHDVLQSHKESTDTLSKNISEAFASTVNLSRLSIPEPVKFSGDPLKFIE